MTEKEVEEQAEEMFNKHILEETCYVSNPDEKIYSDGFSDGAKWGMEHQWHDLRKDPTDLPKEKGEYRVYFYDSELKANRNVNWYYYGKSWGCRLDVIAWCELPQFKE